MAQGWGLPWAGSTPKRLHRVSPRVVVSQHAVPPEVDDTRRRIQALKAELETLKRETTAGMTRDARLVDAIVTNQSPSASMLLCARHLLYGDAVLEDQIVSWTTRSWIWLVQRAT